jgi:hypothetical protein
MVRFLLALCHESKRATSYWIAPLCPNGSAEALTDFGGHEHGLHINGDHSEEFQERGSDVELLESELHAKEFAGLITLSVVPSAGNVGSWPKPSGPNGAGRGFRVRL